MTSHNPYSWSSFEKNKYHKGLLDLLIKFQITTWQLPYIYGQYRVINDWVEVKAKFTSFSKFEDLLPHGLTLDPARSPNCNWTSLGNFCLVTALIPIIA